MATCSATCESCCSLCRSPFDTVSSKSKLLYGASATIDLSVLKDILLASVNGTTLSSVPQLANAKAWLCIKCLRSLSRSKQLEVELGDMVVNVCSKVLTLQGIRLNGN